MSGLFPNANDETKEAGERLFSGLNVGKLGVSGPAAKSRTRVCKKCGALVERVFANSAEANLDENKPKPCICGYQFAGRQYLQHGWLQKPLFGNGV